MIGPKANTRHMAVVTKLANDLIAIGKKRGDLDGNWTQDREFGAGDAGDYVGGRCR